jgi:hypothetical protein
MSRNVLRTSIWDLKPSDLRILAETKMFFTSVIPFSICFELCGRFRDVVCLLITTIEDLLISMGSVDNSFSCTKV